MTSCTSIDALITPYVDEELAPDDRERVERHVDGCDRCRRRLVLEREARQALRQHAPALRAVSVPPALRARLSEIAGQPALPRRGGSAGGRPIVRVAIAASVVLVGGLLLATLMTRQTTTVLAAQLAADHMKCFQANRGGDVLDPQAVAALVRERYGFEATVPGSDESLGLKLVGIRRCTSGEGANAHLLYSWRGEPVSLYVLPGSAHGNERRDVLGQKTEMWAGRNGTYVLVMPESGASTASLVAYMRQATATGYN